MYEKKKDGVDSSMVARAKEDSLSRQKPIFSYTNTTANDLIHEFEISLGKEVLKLDTRPEVYAKFFKKEITRIIPSMTVGTSNFNLLKYITKLVPLQYGKLSMTLIHHMSAVWMYYVCIYSETWKFVGDISEGAEEFAPIIYAILALNGHERCKSCGIPKTVNAPEGVTCCLINDRLFHRKIKPVPWTMYNSFKTRIWDPVMCQDTLCSTNFEFWAHSLSQHVKVNTNMQYTLECWGM